MSGVEGFMYPNEIGLQWSVLIVLYPFITGLVAGAFILASLERVFNVTAVKPTYRLALLTALAFLLVAPLPLQLHLGHPERSPEMYFTPHSTSAMAMFGYVYLWYLMAVLVLEIWLDYRRDIVMLSKSSKGLLRVIYKVMTLGSSNISERSLAIDERVGWIVTLIGIPSAFLLHGYVGFIFGSIKANPWWSSPLMPVVFIFSAMVSGIAGVMLLYMAITKLRKLTIDVRCVDTIAMYLFYIFIIDFDSSATICAVVRISRVNAFRCTSEVRTPASVCLSAGIITVPAATFAILSSSAYFGTRVIPQSGAMPGLSALYFGCIGSYQ